MRNLSKATKLFLLSVIATVFLVQSSIWASPVSLIEDNGTEIKLKFSLPGYSLEKVKVEGKIYTQIKSSGAAVNLEKGEPELPYFTQSIAIPSTDAMELVVIDAEYDEISIGKIISSKGAITRNIDPETVAYTFNDTYQKNEWINETAAEIGTPYILRDIRGVAVNFKPFSYNPFTGKLKIAKSIIVSAKSVTGRSVNVLKSVSNKKSAIFNNIYKNHFINFTSTSSRYTPIGDTDKMIVIAPSEYMAAADSISVWKNQKGIETKVYEYPGETGGSGASAVKSFIQGKYDSEGISYILIIGDYEDIPSELKTYTSSSKTETVSSDPSYIKLAGNDEYPDAFIGRISCNSASQAMMMVKKVLDYEREPDEGGDWYHKAVGIASSEGTPTDYQWMEGFRETLEAYNYTLVNKIYQGQSGTTTDMSNYINEGRGWVNFMGHGSQTGFGFQSGFWYTSTMANNLSNGNKLPVVISVACNNGQFKGATCFAESWTRNSNGGAIVMTASSPLMDWTPPQSAQEEMVNLLSQDKYISVGAIFYNGEMKMLDNGGGSKSFHTWNYFGDPSLMVITDAPEQLNLTGLPASLGSGNQSISLNYGENIDGRVCVYSASNGILASEILSGDNSSTLSINITDEDEVTVTVTARNKMPVIEKVSVSSGPSITVTSPNGGEKINTGTSFTITWDDNIDSDVKIELYKGGSSAAIIADATASDGSFTWDVDVSLADGNDYKIKIIGDGAEDLSDANFTIGSDVADKYTLTVNKGSGDGEYTEGASVEIVADAAPDGEIFDKWTGDVDGIDNVKSATATIVMPGKNISVSATYKVKPSDNLIFIASWEGNSDSLSSFDLDTTKIFSDTLLTASFNVGASVEAQKIYPWANITGYLDTNIDGVTEIELTYKSDKAMFVILDQEGLTDDGNSWQAKIDASSSWKTVTLLVNETVFSQPEWKTVEAPLDLTKVFSISFQPDVDGSTANFELESGYLYGYVGGATPNSSVFKAKSIAEGLNIFSSTKIGFTIKNAGNYKLKVFSLDGKTIFKSVSNYAAGTHSVNWNGANISKGIYLVSLEGINNKFIRKAIVK